VVFVLIPVLGLIFLVLGTIFPRRCNPTEGAARWAATGALIMALARGRLSVEPPEASDGYDGEADGVRRLHSRRRPVFSLTFYGVNGHVWVENC
jgi:TRAP-type mannitol/chloroaromatic compound transport system permease large subunit